MIKPKVLFLCTGNSARSQMAEAFLRAYAGDYFDVYSAGLEPKEINPLTYQVMREIGFDLSGHTSKHLSQYLGKTHFGYVVTVCDRAEQNCPIFPGMGVRLHWSFEDPAAFVGSPEERLNRFRQVRNQIEARISAWLLEMGIGVDVSGGGLASLDS
jgi:arsenate reductase